jgi:hypothetical protein
MESDQDREVRREKVFVHPEISVNDLMETYGLSRVAALRTKRQGWFVKNYSRKQVIIDRESFNPAICYSIAKQVFYKNFRKNPLAQNMKEDLIQEAVTLMFMQSGKIKEGANEKYNDKYGYWWTAHNAMLAFLKSWERPMRYCESLETVIHPLLNQRRHYSPELGWIYC